MRKITKNAEIQLMTILEKVCDVAKKVGPDDYDVWMKTTDLATKKITLNVIDLEKIKNVRTMVLTLYHMVAEERGRLAFIKRKVFLGEVLINIKKILIT